MTTIDKIYRKEMILHHFKSTYTNNEWRDYLLALCNLYSEFFNGCVRTYRGKLSITKRIERIRSGNHKY